ncbi:hypothetical protein DFH09DRAFT_1310427 [Mycena vulgaris]|nr:hypothetical protein DFH09DRAFT_1310427 [Mycena vulgaris]
MRVRAIVPQRLVLLQLYGPGAPYPPALRSVSIRRLGGPCVKRSSAAGRHVRAHAEACSPPLRERERAWRCCRRCPPFPRCDGAERAGRRPGWGLAAAAAADARAAPPTRGRVRVRRVRFPSYAAEYPVPRRHCSCAIRPPPLLGAFAPERRMEEERPLVKKRTSTIA